MSTGLGEPVILTGVLETLIWTARSPSAPGPMQYPAPWHVLRIAFG